MLWPAPYQGLACNSGLMCGGSARCWDTHLRLRGLELCLQQVGHVCASDVLHGNGVCQAAGPAEMISFGVISLQLSPEGCCVNRKDSGCLHPTRHGQHEFNDGQVYACLA